MCVFGQYFFSCKNVLYIPEDGNRGDGFYYWRGSGISSCLRRTLLSIIRRNFFRPPIEGKMKESFESCDTEEEEGHSRFRRSKMTLSEHAKVESDEMASLS